MYCIRRLGWAVALAALAAPGRLHAQQPPAPKAPKPLLYHKARPQIQKLIADNDEKSAKSLMLMLDKADRTSQAMLRRVTLIQSGDPSGIAPPATPAQAKRQREDLIKHLEKLEAYWQWQVVVSDLQEAIGQMTDAEATAVFLDRLPRLRPSSQLVVLMGLSRHPPSEPVDAEVLKLMLKSRESQVRIACIEPEGTSAGVFFYRLSPASDWI